MAPEAACIRIIWGGSRGDQEGRACQQARQAREGGSAAAGLPAGQRARAAGKSGLIVPGAVIGKLVELVDGRVIAIQGAAGQLGTFRCRFADQVLGDIIRT